MKGKDVYEQISNVEYALGCKDQPEQRIIELEDELENLKEEIRRLESQNEKLKYIIKKVIES